MLQNAYFLAKIGADTAENERHLPKFCQKLATTLLLVATPPVAAGGAGRGPSSSPGTGWPAAGASRRTWRPRALTYAFSNSDLENLQKL